jgi:shikimate kinase
VSVLLVSCPERVGFEHVALSSDSPIFLVGFMASGKTTVGRLLAEGLGWTFADLDELVTRAAGRTVPEIFAAEGEAGFRRREGAAVREAASRSRVVVATGGGAACREENLAAMLDSGRVIALGVSPEEAIRRAGGASGRPLLDGKADPVGEARRLLEVRRAFYERAHIRLQTDGRTPSEIAQALLAELHVQPGAA